MSTQLIVLDLTAEEVTRRALFALVTRYRGDTPRLPAGPEGVPVLVPAARGPAAAGTASPLGAVSALDGARQLCRRHHRPTLCDCGRLLPLRRAGRHVTADPTVAVTRPVVPVGRATADRASSAGVHHHAHRRPPGRTALPGRPARDDRLAGRGSLPDQRRPHHPSYDMARANPDRHAARRPDRQDKVERGVWRPGQSQM